MKRTIFFAFFLLFNTKKKTLCLHTHKAACFKCVHFFPVATFLCHTFYEYLLRGSTNERIHKRYDSTKKKNQWCY